MMGAILSYFGSKMYLLLMGADLNAQFKIVYADGSKMTDKTESNISDLRSAGENDINPNIKVRRGGILTPRHTFIFTITNSTPNNPP